MDLSSGGFCQVECRCGVSSDHNCGTTAAICRDKDGSYLGSSVLVIQGLLDAATLEAIACREALSLAEDLNLKHLHIASDCIEVVNGIQVNFGGAFRGSIIGR